MLVPPAVGCGGESFESERALHIALEVGGLPEDASAGYAIFLADTVAIAHGAVGSDESDTVRVRTSAAVTVRWQDARATITDAEYVFHAAEPETVIGESHADTTAIIHASYSLASGGFALATPGIPAGATGFWSVRSDDLNEIAGGQLSSGQAIRRGDLPPGSARLQLDTAFLELDGVRHAYTPPQLDFPLSVTVSFDLTGIDAPYLLASVAIRTSASGLPAGSYAAFDLNATDGSYGVSSGASADSALTLDLIPPGSYTMHWNEVTANGTTYLPDPESQPATLTPNLEPYDFAVTYTPVP
jgi:hypothetical protein